MKSYWQMLRLLMAGLASLACVNLFAQPEVTVDGAPQETKQAVRAGQSPSVTPSGMPTGTPTSLPTAIPTATLPSGALPACKQPSEVGLDEMTLAFVARWGGKRDLYLASADGSRTVRITNDTENEYFPQWSPFGHRLAFSAGVYIHVIDYQINMTTWLEPESLYYYLDWSPEGDKIAYVGYWNEVNDLWLVDVQTGVAVNLTRNRTSIPRDPRFSPDGQLILFHVDPPMDADPPLAQWFTIRTDGTDLRELSLPGILTYRGDWHLDSSHLRFIGHALSSGLSDTYVASLDGDVWPLEFGPSDARGWVWSPDGSLVAYESGGLLHVATADEALDFPVMALEQKAGVPAGIGKHWAPDNRRLAYTVLVDQTGATSDLFLLDICDGSTRLIAKGIVLDNAPPSWRAER